MNGVWSAWQDWSDCSVTCGQGSQQRQRVCTPPRNNGSPCSGSDTDIRTCSLQVCPVDGRVIESVWSDCSHTCGVLGTQTKERSCDPPVGSGLPCPAFEAVERRECNRVRCPVITVDGEVSPWGSWSSCSRTCGGGISTRSRSCVAEAKNGGTTCDTQGLEETNNCNVDLCPADGIVSNWMDWGGCSETCGDGNRERRRTCEKEAVNGGKTCADIGLSQVESCRETSCPVDAVLSEWDEWAACSASCGPDAVQTRNRSCLSDGQHGGSTCDSQTLNEQRSWDVTPCPIDAMLSPWKDWNKCSVSCGDGTKTRERVCESEGQHGGTMCSDFELVEMGSCSPNPCPVDGVLSDWTDWTDCSVTCGEGSVWRNRTCFPAQIGRAHV